MDRDDKPLVLIVDDNPQNLQAIGHILKKQGYDIAIAENGIEALEFVRNTPPEVILLDVMMPEMDGFEVCKRLKKDANTKDIPVIFVTARVETDHIVKGFEIGGVDYVTKPFNSPELLARVNTQVMLKKSFVERTILEERLRQAAILEATGRLAGGIAHDFNNILSGIMGYISLAQFHVKIDSKAAELLSKAENASIRAKELTAKFLTFATGGEPVKDPKFIGGLIKDSVEIVLSGSNVRCISSILPDLDPIEIDETQIRNALTDLVINAKEAMPDGGIVAVHAENIDVKESDALPLKAGKYVKISIQDFGAGIAPENFDKVFTPYFSTKSRGDQKGMGLGLSGVFSIVTKHKGHIDLESEVGIGTTVNLYFPAYNKKVNQKQDEEAIHPDVDKKVLPQVASTNQARILVMDDEEILRNVCNDLLSILGYEKEFAVNGHQAIELYKKAKAAGTPFDIIILDLTIAGGMGGKEVIQKLREFDPAVTAIASSGYSDDPVLTNFQDYGFQNVLVKPYSLQEIKKQLEQTLLAKADRK